MPAGMLTESFRSSVTRPAPEHSGQGSAITSPRPWQFGQVRSIEINGSFYSLQRPSSYAAWRAATPRECVFAVKGGRFITHMIKLKDPERGLVNFIPRAERLRGKLGPILWQLPPGWKVNVERLEQFLELLPRKHRYAFELRNQTWLTTAVYETLRKYNAAYCIYELAGYQSPMELTADWTYVRLHGPTPLKYQGSYSERQMKEWATRIRGWSRKLEAIYVYFDNDDAAYAVDNALTLKRLLKRGRRAAASVAAAAEDAQKEDEDVDEVEIERERPDDGEVLPHFGCQGVGL